MRKIVPSKESKDFVFSFDRNRPPIATVKAGETIDVETLDTTGNLFRSAEGPPYSGPTNHITFPIFVEGAEPGDTLAIDILDIRPTSENIGWCSQEMPFLLHSYLTWTGPRYGYPSFLPKYPARAKFFDVSSGEIDYPLVNGKTIKIGLEPMIGTIGIAPENHAPSTSEAGDHGGNMDSRDCSKGNRLYLPVFVKGALLGVGDTHGRQGQGELDAVPLIVPTWCTLKVDVIKNKTIPGPRIENDRYLIAVGNQKPVEDAIRLAMMNLFIWVEDEYDIDVKEDANMLLSMVSEIEVNAVANPVYSVSVKWPKEYLPR